MIVAVYQYHGSPEVREIYFANSGAYWLWSAKYSVKLSYCKVFDLTIH